MDKFEHNLNRMSAKECEKAASKISQNLSNESINKMLNATNDMIEKYPEYGKALAKLATILSLASKKQN